VAKNKSIFAHEFYAPLLAMGEIPIQESIDEDLLQAMSVLIGRSIDGYFDPMECKALVALIVLAQERGLVGSSLSEAAPHGRAKSSDCLYKDSNRLEAEATLATDNE